MAHIVLVIDDPNMTIEQLNAKIQRETKPHEAAQNLVNYINALASRIADAEMQVVVRDTDPSVSTSGTNSTDVTYDYK